MSYDIDINGESFNYTSNVSPLFYKHMPGGIRRLDGLRGRSAAKEIKMFLASVNFEREKIGQSGMREKYDADNGWGTFVGAMTFMLNVMEACERHPRHKVWVSA